jgi:tetratricopeptide (TPR) repeat protein
MTTLAVLVDKSLLRRVGTGRYSMHELLRQFAGAHLETSPAERALVAERHSAYYRGFVADRAERLARDDAPAAAAEIRAELGNIRQAWLWAAANERLEGLGQDAYGLMLFFWYAGMLQEGAQWFAQARAQPAGQAEREPGAQALRALLLALHARLLLPQGRHDEALGLAEQAIELSRSSAGATAELFGTLVRGMALRRLGRSAEARELLLRAAGLAQAGPPAIMLADAERLAYNWLCSIALTDDDYPAARAFAERNLAICRAQRMRQGELFARSDLLDIAMASADYAAVRDHGAAVLKLARDLRFREGEALALHDLGRLARLTGDYVEADKLLTQSLAILRSQGNHIRAVVAMQSLAELHRVTGGYARAGDWLDQSLETLRAAAQPVRERAYTLRERALLRRATGDLAGAQADAEAALTLLEPDDGRADRARARILLALLYSDTGRLTEAAAAYDEALTIYLALGLAHRVAEVRLGLATLALAQGDMAMARAQVEALLPALRAPVPPDEPLAAYLVCYRVLSASHDPRAAGLLDEARELLLRRAAGIGDAGWRDSFLNAVPAHRAIMLEPGAALALAE